MAISVTTHSGTESLESARYGGVEGASFHATVTGAASPSPISGWRT